MDANPSHTHTQYMAHVHFVTCPNIGIRIWGEITESSTVLLEKTQTPHLSWNMTVHYSSLLHRIQSLHSVSTHPHPHLGPDKTILAAVSLRYANAT